jgi:tetratricopeptide (TPR) repeat protein
MRGSIMFRKTARLSVALVLGLAFMPALMTQRAFAVDDDTGASPVDLTAVRAKIKAADYAGALQELRQLAEDNQQAEVYNLMGYALRKTGDYETSLSYYNRALQLQPDFKAAREYLGELYVETGHIAQAREQLAALARLCPSGCEEREDLEKALGGL